MLDGHVGFSDDLVGGEDFGSGILNQSGELSDAVLEFGGGFAG